MQFEEDLKMLPTHFCGRDHANLRGVLISKKFKSFSEDVCFREELGPTHININSAALWVHNQSHKNKY